jgi:nitrogen fixation/metabolism regulation signal transduction histidine kinase
VGKTERRLALVVLLTSTLPLVAAVLLARSLFSQASAVWFRPEVGEQLDRGVAVHKDYVAAVKDDMRHQTDALAADEKLRARAREGASEPVAARLGELFARDPRLVSLVAVDAAGQELARRDRGRPVDDATEKSLEVRRPLGDGDDAPGLTATFAVDRKPLDALETGGEIVARYHQMERGREELYGAYVSSFAVLLAITIVVTAALGALLARRVTGRIGVLAEATERAARGDLATRVPVTDTDELGELAAAFNHMLAEIQQSRTRIEFLQRISAWQEMARRLAHEIKNPLTPIQLSAERMRRKLLAGLADRDADLLDRATHTIVQQVEAMKQMVNAFSEYARAPEMQLTTFDLNSLIREVADLYRAQDPRVRQELRLDPAAATIEADRGRVRQILNNLLTNAMEALDSVSEPRLEIETRVQAMSGADGAEIVVTDNGPGFQPDIIGQIFDPYVTSKPKGTGLGLAIVRKIVDEHGGRVEADNPPGEGARVRVWLPVDHAARAAAAPRELRRSEPRRERA